MFKVENSLDNIPIEYFFNILKLEYLRTVKLQGRSFDRINKELKYIEWDYNNIILPSNLQNKTPHKYAMMWLNILCIFTNYVY